MKSSNLSHYVMLFHLKIQLTSLILNDLYNSFAVNTLNFGSMLFQNQGIFIVRPLILSVHWMLHNHKTIPIKGHKKAQ